MWIFLVWVAARGGCLCAGPYGLSLLGITLGDAHAIEAGLLDKMELMRPGFVRLSLPYFATKEEVDYVLAAVAEIADMGCVGDIMIATVVSKDNSRLMRPQTLVLGQIQRWIFLDFGTPACQFS